MVKAISHFILLVMLPNQVSSWKLFRLSNTGIDWGKEAIQELLLAKRITWEQSGHISRRYVYKIWAFQNIFSILPSKKYMGALQIPSKYHLLLYLAQGLAYKTQIQDVSYSALRNSANSAIENINVITMSLEALCSSGSQGFEIF